MTLYLCCQIDVSLLHQEPNDADLTCKITEIDTSSSPGTMVLLRACITESYYIVVVAGRMQCSCDAIDDS